jgi:ubiquinone/menaquinone biosynthesis C-methylase UbiE
VGIWLIALGILGVIGLLLYWQLIIAEGTYLGVRVVTLLYDWAAERYNGMKQFNETDENLLVGLPLMKRLRPQPRVMVLDVATGAGRVPVVLLRQSTFQGTLVGLDRASRMLNVARRDTAPHQSRLTFVQADAMALPFADESFPMVTCLEALEFFPRPRQGLAEMARVLQPASRLHPQRGWLFTTSRVGWEARLMPGKTWRRAELTALLEQLGLCHVEIRAWETIYDQVWAQKVVVARSTPKTAPSPPELPPLSAPGR